MADGMRTGFSSEKRIYDNIRSCPQCGKRIAGLPEGEFCPECREINLFSAVRDYIRSEDVNEYDVAIKFGISRGKVRQWIREGRIEYKEDGGTRVLAQGHCELCGAPLTFGTICTKCKRKLDDNKRQGFAVLQPGSDEDSKMRFLEELRDR